MWLLSGWCLPEHLGGFIWSRPFLGPQLKNKTDNQEGKLSKEEKKYEYFEKYRDSILQNSIAIYNKVYDWIKKYVEDPTANLVAKKNNIY